MLNDWCERVQMYPNVGYNPLDQLLHSAPCQLSVNFRPMSSLISKAGMKIALTSFKNRRGSKLRRLYRDPTDSSQWWIVDPPRRGTEPIDPEDYDGKARESAETGSLHTDAPAQISNPKHIFSVRNTLSPSPSTPQVIDVFAHTLKQLAFPMLFSR